MINFEFKKQINFHVMKAIGFSTFQKFVVVEYCNNDFDTLVEYKSKPVSINYYPHTNRVVVREKLFYLS